jgi:type III restriction enzyme
MSEQGDVLIENPIINSPFKEPSSQFKFGDAGITNEVVSGRRPSSYFIPIAASKKSKSGHQSHQSLWR